MAAIPCIDFVTDAPPPWPARPERANPDSIANRYANFVFSMDLSPEQKDDVGAGVGAWSLWDIPASHASQIDDDRGEDLITVSVLDRIYWLDWRRYQDELDWNAFTPIHRLIRLGPVPANDKSATPEGRSTPEMGYDLSMVKRFREVSWELRNVPSGAPEAQWTVSVAEWGREARTTVTGTRTTAPRMRARIATKGSAGFVITLEHSANEPVKMESWRAVWDVIGQRIRESEVV